MSFLKWPDYLVCCITIVASMGVGLFYSLKGRKDKSTRRYLFGSGNMSMFPVAMSLVVSYESGILMLGIPTEVYLYGMQWYISQIAHVVVSIMAVYVLIPPLKRLNVASIHQYIELRYGSRKLRLFVTIMNMLTLVNYLGNVVFVPAVALSLVSHISKDWSINGIMAVVVVYTLIGGFKAVIWTDVFQAILMLSGMLSILIKGTVDAGGIQTTWNTIAAKGRLNFFDFNPDPTIRQSFWSLFIGTIISKLVFPYNQTIYQRLQATPTEVAAKRMYLTATFGFMFITLLAALEGAIMFAYYDFKGCNPLVDNQLTNTNQMIVKMVTEIFDAIPCLPGLFLSSLFSASLSTMSSILISLSALFSEDIVKSHMRPMSEKRIYLITQFSVFLFGVMGICVAYVIYNLKGPVSQIMDTTDACFRSATSGIYLLAWFVPWSNTTGAFVGGILSTIVIGWISYGKYTSTGVRKSPTLESASIDKCMIYNVSETLWNSTLHHEINTTLTPMIEPDDPQGFDLLYSLSYKWLFPLGLMIVLISGSIISRLQAKTAVDPALVVSVQDVLCWFIPRRLCETMRLSKRKTERNEAKLYDRKRAKEENNSCNSEERQQLEDVATK